MLSNIDKLISSVENAAALVGAAQIAVGDATSDIDWVQLDSRILESVLRNLDLPAIAAALAEIATLRAELDDLRRLWADRDAREVEAGKRCGVDRDAFGVDWLERVAARLVAVAAERDRLAAVVVNSIVPMKDTLAAVAEERKRCATLARRREGVYARKSIDKAEPDVIREHALFAVHAMIALRTEIEREPTNDR